MMPKAFDEEEQILMDMVENSEFEPVSEEEKGRIRSLVHGNSKSISIRINEHDLDGIKKNAERAGMPYQTFINMILHRYLSGDIQLKNPI